MVFTTSSLMPRTLPAQGGEAKYRCSMKSVMNAYGSCWVRCPCKTSRQSPQQAVGIGALEVRGEVRDQER